jgi:hypothetical protein
MSRCGSQPILTANDDIDGALNPVFEQERLYAAAMFSVITG